MSVVTGLVVTGVMRKGKGSKATLTVTSPLGIKKYSIDTKLDDPIKVVESKSKNKLKYKGMVGNNAIFIAPAKWAGEML